MPDSKTSFIQSGSVIVCPWMASLKCPRNFRPSLSVLDINWEMCHADTSNTGETLASANPAVELTEWVNQLITDFVIVTKDNECRCARNSLINDSVCLCDWLTALVKNWFCYCDRNWDNCQWTLNSEKCQRGAISVTDWLTDWIRE